MKLGSSSASRDGVKQHITDLCLRWSGIESVGLRKLFRQSNLPGYNQSNWREKQLFQTKDMTKILEILEKLKTITWSTQKPLNCRHSERRYLS